MSNLKNCTCIIKKIPTEKWTSWTNPMIYEANTNVQKLYRALTCPFQGQSASPMRLNRLYLQKAEYRLSAANCRNGTKIVDLVHFQKVLGLSWFYVLLCLIIIYDLHPNHARSSHYTEQRCAQARPLFQILRTMRLSASKSHRKNDASDWMRHFMPSVYWYLSTGKGLKRFWKGIEVRERFAQNQKVTLPVQYSFGSVTFFQFGNYCNIAIPGSIQLKLVSL